MSEITPEVKEYWRKFCESDESFSHLIDSEIDAWSFGDNKEMADELGALVLGGKKTATTSLFYSYRGYENELPKIATYQIILDGDKSPLCVIQCIKTELLKFKDVSEEHAYKEGEGDLSYDYWYKEHVRFFSKYKSDFNDKDLVVTEEFKIVFKS